MIKHPRTVWAVKQNSLGDLVTGCEDYKIRTFTRDFTRRDEGEGLKDFEADLKAATSGPDLDKLDDLDKLTKIKGKREGEIRVFRNGPTAEAYMWKMSEQQWEKIGDVINPSGS